jgi:membrane protease YdiL (CAAX protease family)
MAAIKLAVAVVSRLTTGLWPLFGNEAWYVIIVAIVISTPVQAGEEIGWRGYALPRLAVRLGLARASLLLGFIWACWHLPLFFLPGMDKYGQSFPMFVLGGIALSVAIAWLYANIGGSLLLTMLMHSAVNQTVGIVPSAVANAANPFALSTSLVAWLTDAFLWITAGYFLARMRHIEWSGVETRPAKSAAIGPSLASGQPS